MVLAAGSSQRMGRPKQLLEFAGESLVARAVRVATESACTEVFVVLGAASDDVARALRGFAAGRIVNARFAEGLSTSIAAGLRAVLAREVETGESWDGVMLVLADQPRVSRAALDALVARFRDAGAGVDAIAASAYRGTLGPPALFGREHFEALGALAGDAGAKTLLTNGAQPVLAVPCEEAAVDVDTPDDYHALLSEDARES